MQNDDIKNKISKDEKNFKKKFNNDTKKFKKKFDHEKEKVQKEFSESTDKMKEELKKQNEKVKEVADNAKKAVTDKANEIKEDIKNSDAEKIKALEDALLRRDADMVNYRKRKDEEVSKKLEYANEDLIIEILPIVDNFERAISLDDDNLTDELSKFLQGFKMIYCHLVDILNKYDVKAIDGINKPFDPKYHQAVMTEEVDGMKSGYVVEVMQKGYVFKDRVIRPAMVKVSK